MKREIAKIKLSEKLGSRFMTSQESCEEYRSDDSRILAPELDGVVLCESRDDMSLALKIADEERVPITPRAGGSGRTGGAVPIEGGLVLACHQMNQMVDFDRKEGVCVVEPGMNLAELHFLVEKEGWFYPPDPNSADLCCLAGNLGENAAGPRAFKYGATRDYVLGVETVLPGGEVVFSGRRTRKGVTGYDTTALLVGSEGTLAAFGQITLKLIPRPQTIMTLLVAFPAMTDASLAVEEMTAAQLLPRCLEFLDEKTVAIMREDGNPIRKEAGALLIIEVDGPEELCLLEAEKIDTICRRCRAIEVEVAQTGSARDRIWASRKAMSRSVRKRAAHKVSEDVVVPRQKLGLILDEVRAIGERNSIDALAYGHAGDGNLHVNFLWDTDEEKKRVDQSIIELFRATIDLGGTLSGEHGIGLLKAPYLTFEQPPALIALQERLKKAFDPHGVMNPGKIFPRHGHGNC